MRVAYSVLEFTDLERRINLLVLVVSLVALAGCVVYIGHTTLVSVIPRIKAWYAENLSGTVTASDIDYDIIFDAEADDDNLQDSQSQFRQSDEYDDAGYESMDELIAAERDKDAFERQLMQWAGKEEVGSRAIEMRMDGSPLSVDDGSGMHIADWGTPGS